VAVAPPACFPSHRSVSTWLPSPWAGHAVNNTRLLQVRDLRQARASLERAVDEAAARATAAEVEGERLRVHAARVADRLQALEAAAGESAGVLAQLRAEQQQRAALAADHAACQRRLADAEAALAEADAAAAGWRQSDERLRAEIAGLSAKVAPSLHCFRASTLPFPHSFSFSRGQVDELDRRRREEAAEVAAAKAHREAAAAAEDEAGRARALCARLQRVRRAP